MINLELWKKRKKEQKFTIAEIAHNAKLPKGTVQNIFAGYIPNPRIDTVQAIEKALGINGEIALSKSTSQNIDEERLLKAFYRLVPTVRAYALEMIEKLADCQMHLQT